MADETGAETPAAPAEAASAETKPTGDALVQRLRSDPEFAVEQYKKLKSENTKLFQKYQAIEPVAKIADQLGGADPTTRYIYEYDAILKHPSVAKIVDAYRRTGTLPTDSSTDQDTSEDLYQDPQTVKINELERQLNDLRAKVSQTQGTVGKQAVMGHFARLREKYQEGFDEYAVPFLNSKMEELERTPQGREVLNNLSFEQLDALAAKAVSDHLLELGEKRYLRTLEDKKRAATGAVAPNLSSGREPAANQKGHSSGYEAWREFSRLNGVDRL